MRRQSSTGKALVYHPPAESAAHETDNENNFSQNNDELTKIKKSRNSIPIPIQRCLSEEVSILHRIIN